MRLVIAWLGSPTTVVLALTLFCNSAVGQQPQVSPPGKTRIVLLGTGTPGPLPDRSGPATAVVVNDVAYLVDFGPGVVRRANAAFLDRDINALEPTKLRVVNAHEIGPGVIYKDANVTVTAFATKHAMESYGYRFDTADRSIVISGDTNPTQETIDACHGCDVLIHEAHSPAWLATRPDYFQQFAAKFHTTTTQLAELATKARPRLLILYHYVSVSPEDLYDEMVAQYEGHFVVGRDLDVY